MSWIIGVRTVFGAAVRLMCTKRSDACGGNIVDQVERVYNGLGQFTVEYQSHSGAVNVNSTSKVQRAYSVMSGGANHSRLTSKTYPDGFVANYNYSSS